MFQHYALRILYQRSLKLASICIIRFETHNIVVNDGTAAEESHFVLL